jgi:small subunit ribosomal protein S17
MSETQTDSRPNLRKTRIGIVKATKMDKTIIVESIARVPHPRFKKIIKRSKKYYVHDEDGTAKVGDRVRIVETKPISKTKCWNLDEVISH